MASEGNKLDYELAQYTSYLTLTSKLCLFSQASYVFLILEKNNLL